MEKVFLSVIIVTYNCGANIKKTLDSLLGQQASDYEVVFVDGDSSDDTKEIILEYINALNNTGIKTLFISEPDKGIYDAMNKGIDSITGEWCYFLNAGDVLYSDDVFSSFFSAADKEYDVIYGNTLDDFGKKKVLERPGDIEGLRKKMVFCHQAVFTKSDAIRIYKYDKRFKYCADYNLYLTLLLEDYRFKHFDQTIVIYSREGISSSNTFLVLKEYRQIQKEKGIYGIEQASEYWKRIVLEMLRELKRRILG